MGPLFEEPEQTSTSTATKFVGVLCALILTASVCVGYLLVRKRHAERELQKSIVASPPPRPMPAAKLEIVENEALLKGSNAVVTGKVRNISSERLSGISIEVVLNRRNDGNSETRFVAINPSDLEPGQESDYSFPVSRDYRSFKISSVRSGSDSAQVPFKTIAGARRPLEGPPASKTTIVKRPAPRGGAEEFINTPENPSRVP
jgi:hypothetical protein